MVDALPATRLLRSRFQKALIVEDPDIVLDAQLQAMGIFPDRLAHVPEEDELVELLRAGQHDLIFKRSRLQITDRVLGASEKLAAVMLCSIGHDSVDKAAAARHGVLVTHDPVSNGRSVAELVIAEIIAGSRRMVDTVNETAAATWAKNNRNRFEVKGKKIGIVGMGKIGRQVAQLATALGMEVVFHDTDEIAVEVGVTLGYKSVDELKKLFQVADIVSVHVSATDVFGRSNEGLLSYEVLAALGDKQGLSPRLFLNLARGVLHSTTDLRRAVEEGHIGYGFIDVFPDEPQQSTDRDWDNPYKGEPRIFATPHIGAATLEAQPRIAKYVAQTTKMLNLTGTVRNCVFMPKATINLRGPSERHYLAVVHTDRRGTKKAVDDMIYQAGASNLQSAHIDFPKYGIAYDLSALDTPLGSDQLADLALEAARLTGDPGAIRAIRMITAEG